MAVSLRQLEYFVTVVDEGSFTAAAQVLHVSQPGLSHQIQALERELGGPLLERLPRKVRLTPAGRTVLPHARASLAHAERASSAGRRASGIATGELHVGTLFSISTGILPPALRTWRTYYPELRVQLVEFRHSDDLIAAMEAGNADLAVGPTPPGWDGPVREIGIEEFVIAAAPDAELPTDSHRVRMADLAEHQWVHFIPQSGLSEILNRACKDAGFEPRVAVRTEQSPSAINLALAGLGLALVPGNNIPRHFEGTVLRPDPPVRRPLSVYTRVRPDPITAAFVDAIADRTLVNPPHIARRLCL
ncbi:DNA-binding transcriptional LysR family regulator [Kitasatospora sp. MAP12-15]|uniref:LysR family transcriptional regulator n=1 Tax=unclassified Kitasatospora TaxID=2633591 RepID=UPI0024736319|nr:LysR family transcriptional regulator [Kitasatospora sp. MAP12-44]MDH6113584.1 DNA-binding transcriptional LysR family regulator [Kitasatospora sp. MAP12-44]